MQKNIFYNAFLWLVNCYDHSIFEKIISSICGFFKEKSKDSFIVGLFREKPTEEKLWGKSITAKVIRFFPDMCRKFYHKNQLIIENKKENSSIMNFLADFGSYSLRDFGKIFIALGIGFSIGTILFQRANNFLVVVSLMLIGAFLWLSDNSYLNLASGSFIVSFARKTIAYYDNIETVNHPVRHFEAIKYLIGVSGIAGIVMSPFNPIDIGLAIVTAVLVLLILWRTEIGVYIFVPMSAILPTMVSAGLVALAFLSYVLHLIFGKEGKYVSTSMQGWIAVFIGFVIYSALTGPSIKAGIPILMIYLVFTMAYILIVNTITTRSQWKALVILFVAAATVVALFGIFQNFFMASTTASWVDEEMFTDIKTRVYSTLDNPNVLGEYFILMIPIAVALLLKIQGGMQKVIYTLCNLAMFLCLMYTWSRGAWIGVVLGIVFFILLKDRRWLVICFVGLLLMPSILPESIMARLTSIGNMKDSSTSYRVAIWLGSIKMLKDYWLTGVGLGSEAFLSAYPRYALGGADFALHSHNFYLQWIVDMGITGIVIYAGIMLNSFKTIASVKEKNTLIKTVLLAMAGAMIGYLFQGMAENLWYNYRMILVFWIYIGMLQSGAILADDGHKRKEVIK